MKNCPYCEDIAYHEYSKKDMRFKFIGNLIPKYELKYGRLLQCPDCENYWYDDYEPYHQYRALLKQNLQSTLAWNSNLPIASIKQKSLLKEIKATPPDRFGNKRDFIEFPVSCSYNNNWIDACIVRFQKLPPFLVMFKYYNDFITLDAIDDIRPSEFTLPIAVRGAGSLTDEVRMGFNPILTSGPNQKFYVVQAMQNFFFGDGIKGCELKLASFFSKVEEKSMVIGSFALPIKYVIVDWDEEMIKYRA